MSILSRPHFQNDEAAFAYLESAIWPNGPVCAHCGCMGRITRVKANADKRIRIGLYRCGDCKKQFRATVRTVFEHARIPLHKCLQATHLMCSSKKGVSAHQIHRTLEIGYKAAWFLCHRILEAMRDDAALSTIMGGPGQVVEADETYIGGKAKNRATRQPAKKKAVLSLVESDGRVRSEVVSRHKRRDVLLLTSVITTSEVLHSRLPAGVANLFAADQFAGKTLPTPDALHLATATMYRADEFYTFDERGSSRSLGLLPLSGNVAGHRLKVCKPRALNPELDLKKPKIS